MRLHVLVVFVAVITWNIVVTDGGCYTKISSSTSVPRYRYKAVLYYTRTFTFGWRGSWRREACYRKVRVTYYVRTTVYRNKEIPCPVDGGWSDWKPGICSVTCGNGTVWSTRECNNPRPANGGKYCIGDHLYVKNCYKGCCPVDGAWSEWIDLDNCSRECGDGALEQFRLCDNPEPKCGGRACTGPKTQVIGCNPQCCPVNGGWSDWMDIPDAECSRSCRTGFKRQFRSCINPVPECGGEACEGTDNRMIACNEHCCPVNGGWSEWEDISECTASCGLSFKQQYRSCSEPSTSCGGLPCIGNDHRLTLCDTTCCPVDGGWSHWEAISDCSATCGGGVVTKSRTCTNPSPSCGGSDCQGDNVTNVFCNIHCCPVDGGWSDWKNGSCSVSCGGGSKEKFRICNNPKPSCGGKECSGMKMVTLECNEFSCDDKGNNTDTDIYASGVSSSGSGGSGWGSYSECSVSCGKGTRYRIEECNGECKNEILPYEYEECDMGCCPVDGGWTEWKPGYPCSATCGEGIETFYRTCTNPEPECGGKECNGEDTRSKTCDTQIPCLPEVN